jgi:hypothetical protein
MGRKHFFFFFVFGALAFGGLLALSACGSGKTPTPIVIRETVEVTASSAASVEVPFIDKWSASAHADASAEAFNHWNEDDPAQIPTTCAKCHSTPGYRDFLGIDGTAAGTVDNAAPIGTVISCVACHNDATMAMTSVVMPSGLEITGLGPEARCMQCHQGRESTVSVNAALDKAGVGDDTVSADLGFINVHYLAAGATKYGAMAEGGYQYAGKSYDVNFAHVDGVNSCVTCHDMHSLELRIDTCQTCHTNVKTADDTKNIRMNGSLEDYDGDGNVTEGIAMELQGLQEKLYSAIQVYASEVAKSPIAYDGTTYPYFFVDTNSNGQVDTDEAQVPNAFKSWTPRLVKATYNYQFSLKDPGAFAHNGKYVIELLTDSIDDLNSAVKAPVDMAGTHRIDAGHFAGSEEAFRHWDADGEVPGSCSRCHSAEGLPLFLEQGVSINQPVSNGMQCANCHTAMPAFTRYAPETIAFPSGAQLGFENTDANLCIACHQGRESTVSVNRAIANSGAKDDQVSDQLRFINPHYFAAGATLFGDDAKGAYEYAGKSYNGRFQHVASMNSCVACHDAHTLEVQVDKCAGCHDGITDVASTMTIRASSSQGIDFDGDGNSTEGIGQEVATMKDILNAAIQNYAKSRLNAPIAYNPDAYPYFFADTNGNGTIDPDEANAGNSYASWSPRLLRAAYNLQWVQKDPGAFAHNGQYIMQILYDSIKDVGGSTAGMTRP